MSKELNQHTEQAEGAQGERIVQTAPERIYLIIGADCPRDVDFSELSEVMWCEDDIDDGIEYVRADKAAALAQPSPKFCACAKCDDAYSCSTDGCQFKPVQAQPSPAPELDDQAFDRNAERLTFQALGPGAGINPEATSIDDIFIDEAPAPELPERGTQHRFSTTEQTCRHDFAGVWWSDAGVTKTGRECRYCGFFVADMTEAPEQPKRYTADVFYHNHFSTVQMEVVRASHFDEFAAQSERIVEALRADLSTLIEVRNGLVEEIGELHSELADVREERNAAQAKLDELEKQQPVAWVTETDPDVTMGRGINWFPKNVAKLLVGTKLYAAPVAQAPAAMPPFAEKVLAKLRRFQECAEDFESGGVDIGRHWLDLLTQLGLLNRVQRSPAFWEISQQGEDLLEAPVAQAVQVPEGCLLVTTDQVERHSTTAWECPPQSRVVLLSTLQRLTKKNMTEAPQPTKGE